MSAAFSVLPSIPGRTSTCRSALATPHRLVGVRSARSVYRHVFFDSVRGSYIDMTESSRFGKKGTGRASDPTRETVAAAALMGFGGLCLATVAASLDIGGILAGTGALLVCGVAFKLVADGLNSSR